MEKNVICMKWGTKFGAEYANRLYKMVEKNLTVPHRFVCFTDDPTGLDAGIEVLFDDRGEKPGFMFSDADLLGIPLRIVISPKTLADNEVEFKIRGEKESSRLPLAGLKEFIQDKIAQAMK